MLILSKNSKPFLKNDQIICLNGHEVTDIIDLRYFLEPDNAVLTKRASTNLSISASENNLRNLTFLAEIPKVKTCRNKCLFCFIDQLPTGLRKTLYFKDDDWRLSFLSGNFITLTNLKAIEIERIINQKISPLYISVHVADPDTRELLLGIKNSQRALEGLKRLDEGGIQTHIQIVLCPGINDGKTLINTINSLAKLKNAASVGIVPVGITKYHRQGLIEITSSQAKKLIKEVESLQDNFLREKGTRWLFLADEIYLKAQQRIPEIEHYEEFYQLENGIGMVSQWLDAFDIDGASVNDKFILITGKSFEPILRKAVQNLGLGSNILVQPVENDFFGPKITVTGLLTAQDIIEQVKPQKIPILIPDIVVNENNLFLDDISFKQLREKLPTARLVPSDAASFSAWLKKRFSN